MTAPLRMKRAGVCIAALVMGAIIQRGPTPATAVWTYHPKGVVGPTICAENFRLRAAHRPADRIPWHTGGNAD